MRLTKHFLAIASIAVLTLVSCSKDDDSEPEGKKTLEFELDGAKNVGTFDGNSQGFIVSEGNGATLGTANFSIDGVGSSTASFGLINGASVGTFTLTGGPGETDNSFGMIYGTQTSYKAKNITLKITRYDRIGNSTIFHMEATFEGTLIDESTSQEVQVTNGKMVSGE